MYGCFVRGGVRVRACVRVYVYVLVYVYVAVCAGTCTDVWAYVCADTAWILSAWYVCMHVYMFMYNA